MGTLRDHVAVVASLLVEEEVILSMKATNSLSNMLTGSIRPNLH